MQFDTPPAQFDVDQFRNTVAAFFKARLFLRGELASRWALTGTSITQLDTSQVLINRVYPMGSGSAVDFFALFPDDDAAETFENAVTGALFGRAWHRAC